MVCLLPPVTRFKRGECFSVPVCTKCSWLHLRDRSMNIFMPRAGGHSTDFPLCLRICETLPSESPVVLTQTRRTGGGVFQTMKAETSHSFVQDFQPIILFLQISINITNALVRFITELKIVEEQNSCRFLANWCDSVNSGG